jgi:hypothetical protein
MKKQSLLGLPVLVCLCAAAVTVGASACSHYSIKDKMVFADMNYAKPAPGRFRYVKRNVSATAFWDSETSKARAGSKAYMLQMTSLAVTATKKLLYKVNLQHNQALYNVRISAPSVTDTYFFWVLIVAGFHWKSRASVTITADVIEFL